MNKLKMIILTLLVVFKITSLEAREGSFDSYIQIFDYPEIKDNISSLEFKEMNRTAVSDSGVIYPDKLIKLYLIASDITDENRLNTYLDNFNSKLRKAEIIIRQRDYKNKLNRYNMAEFFLHFLHTEYFAKEQTGSAAGYNIGISETFDDGRFNCYKSALIYNAFLDHFGYKTGYISVPEHIYSLIEVNNRTIDVETTNRYGFDPYNAGKGVYKRVFDKKNIKFDAKYYNNKIPIDNISVLVQVYNNRSLLYSGDMTYSGTRVERNYGRAAALSILGSYLSYNDESYIVNNTLYKVFQVTKDNIDRHPERIGLEYRRYSKVLEHINFKNFSGKHIYNLEVLSNNAVTAIRKRKLLNADKDNMKEIYDLFVEETESAGKYIRKNKSIRNSLWNNSIVEYNDIIEKKYPQGSLDSIKKYGRFIMDFVNNPVFGSGNFIQKYREQYRGNICIFIDNLGITHLNNQKWKEADQLYSESLNFLRKELNINSGYYYKLIIEHHNFAKKNL